MKASEVTAVIETVAPISSGMEGDELGFIHGDGDVEVRGVAVCWSPTLPVIQRAEALGCNVIVSHEPLFYQKRWSVDAEAKNVWFDEAEDQDKVVNRRRREALDRMGGCVWRAHSNWDVAPKMGIIDAIVARIGLGDVVRHGRFTTLHRVAPITVRDLAGKVKQALDTGTIRVTGDLNRTVTRVATMIGGLGQLFNSPEEIAALDAEAVVAGECLAYTMHYAIELGVSVIEAGHCASENPGMRAMAGWLAEELPGVKVQFIDSGHPWSLV